MKDRKFNLFKIACVFAVFFVIGLSGLIPAIAEQQPWWPSRYGPDDELGTLNEITPQRIAEAAKLVGNGKVYSLGTEYRRENPGFPPRFWETTALSHRTVVPLGSNKFVWLEEEFSGCPGVGTQLDGLAHVGIEYAPDDIRFYNGKELSEVLSGDALLQRWGMDKVPQIVTRGILADMVAFKGRELEAGEPITADDLKACLAKQGTNIKPGDSLLVHTGWMRSRLSSARKRGWS